MIRIAGPADAAGIAAVWNALIRDTTVTFTSDEKTDAEVTAAIAEAPVFLVAEDAGRVLGFATYGAFRKGPGYARTAEISICITPSACGRGIGPGLLAALDGHAASHGITALIAGVSGENPRAAAFFEREGYVRRAVLPRVGWKFGRALDLVLLQKMLQLPH